MKKTVYILIICVVYYLGICSQKKPVPDIITTRDTIYSTRMVVNTVTKYMPSPLLCFFLRDTTINGVTLPIEQKVYKDEDYTAYVSGVAPQLDSIQVFPKTVYEDRLINIEKKVPYSVKDSKRWGIGVSAGYGFTRDGPSPYIGLSLNYNIFRF